jgi:Uma2 family endonuclease
MASPTLMTAEQFAQIGDHEEIDPRWTELIKGRIVSLEPPDALHGAVVFNLAKGLAEYLERAPDTQGYAGFEIGLIIARHPDTVRRPPISFFVAGDRFAELDRQVTETRPALVVEVASTNDRRRTMRERAESYLRWGIGTVWVVDTVEKTVHLLERGRTARFFKGEEEIAGAPVLDGFTIRANRLFYIPR